MSNEKQAEALLKKAKESALLAVGIYNNPGVTFRSGSYIVLMVIAWNALLQAIFLKREENFFEQDAEGKAVLIDGEKKALAIRKLIAKYFSDGNNPIRKNLELLILIRDKLEHRFAPQLDEQIFGEF